VRVRVGRDGEVALADELADQRPGHVAEMEQRDAAVSEVVRRPERDRGRPACLRDRGPERVGTGVREQPSVRVAVFRARRGARPRAPVWSSCSRRGAGRRGAARRSRRRECGRPQTLERVTSRGTAAVAGASTGSAGRRSRRRVTSSRGGLRWE
jgi:hypothetical protein